MKQDINPNRPAGGRRESENIAPDRQLQAGVVEPVAAQPVPEPIIAPRESVEFGRGLSTKLLVLTVIFVMVAEIMIFVPSIANFRNVWLQNHLDIA